MWCLQEAQRLGDEFLSLEKYVNLNYLVRACKALVDQTPELVLMLIVTALARLTYLIETDIQHD